jgi:hypothetical protein
VRVGFKFGTRIREEAVDISDLYEEYPDFYINVKREQQLLIEHDIIVFQHPFYWYSSPAILKQWEDLVLEFGFAYGPGGTKLHRHVDIRTSVFSYSDPISVPPDRLRRQRTPLPEAEVHSAASNNCTRS